MLLVHFLPTTSFVPKVSKDTQYNSYTAIHKATTVLVGPFCRCVSLFHPYRAFDTTWGPFTSCEPLHPGREVPGWSAPGPALVLSSKFILVLYNRSSLWSFMSAIHQDPTSDTFLYPHLLVLQIN